MEEDAPVIYGLEFQARAMTAQLAETESIRFLVGTQSFKCDNQIHQIEFDEENNIINKTVFLHRVGEVWHISASPKNADILATCYNKVSDGKCEMRSAIWRLPAEYDIPTTGTSDETLTQAPSLELLCHLANEAVDGDAKCAVWQPGDDHRLFSLVDNQVLLWDLQEGGMKAKLVGNWSVESKAHVKLTMGAWSPHQNCSQIATASETFIRGWDLRTQRQAYTIENAHGTLVRDIDFNPNKQYYLVSCGDDCKVKFWDIRNISEPLKVLDDHSHWVWCVCYNHFHDQLVLTSSSDSRVILHNVSSISSEPFGHLIEDDLNSENGEDTDREKHHSSTTQDGVISTYEEHEDSVYAVAWSSADPWLFASLSYDGRLTINRVPKAVKYKILL